MRKKEADYYAHAESLLKKKIEHMGIHLEFSDMPSPSVGAQSITTSGSESISAARKSEKAGVQVAIGNVTGTGDLSQQISLSGKVSAEQPKSLSARKKRTGKAQSSAANVAVFDSNTATQAFANKSASGRGKKRADVSSKISLESLIGTVVESSNGTRASVEKSASSKRSKRVVSQSLKNEDKPSASSKVRLASASKSGRLPSEGPTGSPAPADPSASAKGKKISRSETKAAKRSKLGSSLSPSTAETTIEQSNPAKPSMQREKGAGRKLLEFRMGKIGNEVKQYVHKKRKNKGDHPNIDDKRQRKKAVNNRRIIPAMIRKEEFYVMLQKKIKNENPFTTYDEFHGCGWTDLWTPTKAELFNKMEVGPGNIKGMINSFGGIAEATNKSLVNPADPHNRGIYFQVLHGIPSPSSSPSSVPKALLGKRHNGPKEPYIVHLTEMYMSSRCLVFEAEQRNNLLDGMREHFHYNDVFFQLAARASKIFGSYASIHVPSGFWKTYQSKVKFFDSHIVPMKNYIEKDSIFIATDDKDYASVVEFFQKSFPGNRIYTWKDIEHLFEDVKLYGSDPDFIGVIQQIVCVFADRKFFPTEQSPYSVYITMMRQMIGSGKTNFGGHINLEFPKALWY
eukprot:TRINITY_DN4402_c0_g1_i1.p1 TRINITY_DN4402_c0_g1~~TRINITY_DN4402_c0_g1_i1.p1  ORF type:complete len:670 (-),score=187.39 TRINITY_DN4402_c0_g1_i1:17-1891(-)